MTTTITHKQVHINGTRLHVAISGPSKITSKENCILCLHGFPEGWIGWRPLMREMPDITIYAPDLRGFPSSDLADNGYDIITLTDDIDQLINELGLIKPILMTHDWGGALGWIYAHRFSNKISRLVVANCPHPKTLVRAVFKFEDFQTFRIPWVPPFQIPFLPESVLTSLIGRKLLALSFTLREGSKGKMDKDLVREIVNRFQYSKTMRGPVNYYREFVQTLLHPETRERLKDIYSHSIQVPVSLIWGLEDGALSAKVAQTSYIDAGCSVEWRPLEGIGHFVDLEAPELLAKELYRLIIQDDSHTIELNTVTTLALA